ncbi:hypothetical protein NDU88_002750 [Pleurodeles waltl]|uniref:Uncharacterized protein n=1 Tax=Pleurodeles waltl TaxID=8319 RepID=A0AAV7SCL0_PLEWA|nr:hypothetical protein NDU88_002750 [Pleurodeles waltl]
MLELLSNNAVETHLFTWKLTLLTLGCQGTGEDSRERAGDGAHADHPENTGRVGCPGYRTLDGRKSALETECVQTSRRSQNAMVGPETGNLSLGADARADETAMAV